MNAEGRVRRTRAVNGTGVHQKHGEIRYCVDVAPDAINSDEIDWLNTKAAARRLGITPEAGQQNVKGPVTLQ